MKLLHIADLHIGKRVNEFNMLNDQKYILEQILDLAAHETPDGILIAGDVYDKSQPSAEAVELLDEFLTKLTELNLSIFMISGNHDSPERLGFGSRILQKNNLYISGVFDGTLDKVTLSDKHGTVNIYLLPFLKPAMVNPFFEQAVDTYDQAVRAVIDAAKVNTNERNVILAHQFIVNGTQQPERSDSENLSVGGLDNVDASAFDAFDYVALGHLHRPQRVGRENVRYAGSPLKYSFSEALHQKSVTVVELGGKGEVSISARPLTPCRDLRQIKGPIAELLRIGKEQPQGADDYLHITLTDEDEIYDAIGKLRQVYPNIMALTLQNSRTEQTITAQLAAAGDISKKSPFDLFAEFYQIQNNNSLTAEQTAVIERIIQKAGGSQA